MTHSPLAKGNILGRSVSNKTCQAPKQIRSQIKVKQNQKVSIKREYLNTKIHIVMKLILFSYHCLLLENIFWSILRQT